MNDGDAIVLVDHGSRRPEANGHIDKLASLLIEQRPGWLVCSAHLELSEPCVPEVIDGCVREGACRIFLHPFFLLPGRHTRDDLPRLAEEARERHPGLSIHVTETLGLDPKLVQIVLDRIDQAAKAADET
ncbi:MAG: CbiX/SirB N-terminal domain-containing protein [Candidatus Binatia bacterium]|nr:CbiX/SirB N-terminal domain-containing protein [Candidatus Binatia bacterium]